VTPFANPLITPVPPAVNISNITNSSICVITTATPHGYSSGIMCKIVIPYPGVMESLNGKTFFMAVANGFPNQLVPITVLSGSKNIQGINTTNIGAFAPAPLVKIVPPIGPPFFTPGQQAQIIPTGDYSIINLTNFADIIGPNNPVIPFPGN